MRFRGVVILDYSIRSWRYRKGKSYIEYTDLHGNKFEISVELVKHLYDSIEFENKRKKHDQIEKP